MMRTIIATVVLTTLLGTALPMGGLIADSTGSFYGTIFVVGTVWLGTVYRLAPAAGGYRNVVLHNFQH